MDSRKIYELRFNKDDEKVWIAANTNIDALMTYFSITSTDMFDLEEEDEIVIVPKIKWHELKVVRCDDEDEPKEQSFYTWMKNNTGSDIIAGTIYDSGCDTDDDY